MRSASGSPCVFLKMRNKIGGGMEVDAYLEEMEKGEIMFKIQ